MTEWVLLVVVTIPLLWLWIVSIVEVIRRPNRPIGRRVLWVVAFLFVPLVALVAYVVMRSPDPVWRSGVAPDVSPSARTFVEAAEARQRHDLSDDEFRSRTDPLFTPAADGR